MTPPSPSPGRDRVAGLAPWALAGATLALWTLLAVVPVLPQLLGFAHPDKWFLDSYAILATGDAVRAGISPDAPNPLDLLQRPHAYSDWWLAVTRTGLTRADNFAVGCTWVAVFLVMAVLVLRVRTWREAAAALVFLASPVVLLAVFRANNDLVIFALLAAAALVFRPDGNTGVVLAAGLVGLATGLKFYPVSAALLAVLLRPRARLAWGGLLFAACAGFALADVWSTMGRGELDLFIDVHKTGAPVLLHDLGLRGRLPQAVGALVLAAAGFVLARTGGTRGLGEAGPRPELQPAFLLGAATLTACFVAGVSHSYRWVAALLVVPWLLALLDGGDRLRRRAAGATLLLLGFVCWADGLLCLVLNRFWSPPDAGAVAALERGWRLATQPLHWTLVALLAGWLWGAVLAAIPAFSGRTARG